MAAELSYEHRTVLRCIARYQLRQPLIAAAEVRPFLPATNTIPRTVTMQHLKFFIVLKVCS